MASINDVINQNLARVMANNGAPLRALADKEDRDEALRIAAANRDREFAQRANLVNVTNRAETERAMQVLGARNRFDAIEGDKNRAARSQDIETQAKAYVDRLTAAEKQKELGRLHALGIKTSGKDADEELADGLQKQAAGDFPSAKGARGLYADYEKRISSLDSKLAAAQKADADYIQKTSRTLGAKTAAEQLALTLSADEQKILGGSPTVESVAKAAKIPTERRNALIAQLANLTESNAAQAAVQLSDSRIDRPTAETLRSLSNEKLKLESQFSQFRNSPAGTLAVNRMLYERGENPESTEAPAAQDSIGIVSGILDNLNKGGTFQPSMGARQVAEAESAQSIPVVPGAARDPERLGLPPGMGSVLSPAVSSAVGTGRGLLQAGYEGLARMTGNMGPAEVSYGTITPQEKVTLSNLFGPDAPDLLPEAAKLATANGISQEQQTATYKAALGGNSDARQKVTEMLDFVRSQRQAPGFVPVFENMQEYPGNVAPSPNNNLGPQLIPAR